MQFYTSYKKHFWSINYVCSNFFSRQRKSVISMFTREACFTLYENVNGYISRAAHR